MSVVQSFNSFNSFNSHVPRVNCSRVDTPPAGLPQNRFGPLSRPVVLKRYGGASVVRVRCPRRRVHVSTNTNGGASVWTCSAWRSVAAWRSVWRVRCPVPVSRPQQRKTAKQERRRVPWRVAFTLSEIQQQRRFPWRVVSRILNRNGGGVVSSTGTTTTTAAAKWTSNNGVFVALFRVRGVSRGKDRQQDNGGARGVSWRVFQNIKERLKTCPVPRVERGAPGGVVSHNGKKGHARRRVLCPYL